MDKTSTWLIRAASLIIILLSVGYISKPLGNKINDLSSSFKDFISKPKIKGIACGQTKEVLNKSDDDFLNRKVLGVPFWLFDKKNGEFYRYNSITNYIFNRLDYYLLINKDSELSYDLLIDNGYIKNSILYINLISYSKNGEEISRKSWSKINLKTLDWYDNANSYSLLGTCRYIKIPKNVKFVEAEKFAN